MLAATVALLPLAFTGFVIARWEGVLFVALYLAYLLYVVLDSTEHDAAQGFTAAMLWLVLPPVGYCSCDCYRLRGRFAPRQGD